VRHVDELAVPGERQLPRGGARPQLDGEIPDDIIEMIVKRAIHSRIPTRRGGKVTAILVARHDTPSAAAAAERLADVLVHDVDGSRSALLAPRLAQLAQDPSVAFAVASPCGSMLFAP